MRRVYWSFVALHASLETHQLGVIRDGLSSRTPVSPPAPLLPTSSSFARTFGSDMTTSNTQSAHDNPAPGGRGELTTKRCSSDSRLADNNPRPTQCSRSLRPRGDQRPMVDTTSSDDDTADDIIPPPLPSTDDVISVCYVDALDAAAVEADNKCDDGNVEWWSATVGGVLPVHDSDEIMGMANVSFWPAHGRPRQESSLLFLKSGLTIEAKDIMHRPTNTSNWHFVSRAAPITPTRASAGRQQTATATAIQPTGRRQQRKNTTFRNEETESAPRPRAPARSVRKSRPRASPSSPVGEREKDTQNLHYRVSLLEAELAVVKRRQLTELELEVVKEIRVETKLGVIAGLRRSPGPLVVREGGREVEAIIQGDKIRWTYKCAMGRFKMLASAVHAFLRGEKQAVVFNRLQPVV